MKLIRARVKNFRSVEDSNEFEIDDLTCLVGKNEAGKTAVLHALYGLKPFRTFSFDRVRDYPRRFLSRFDDRHQNGKSEVIRTWWEMNDDDVALVEKQLGVGTVSSKTVEIWKGIGFDSTYWELKINHAKCLEGLFEKHKLDAVERATVKGANTTQEAAALLEKYEAKTEKHSALLKELKSFRESSATLAAIDVLNIPKFFYTSHYDRMSGEISLTSLAQDKANNRLSAADQIFLDFLEYAGTSVEELQKARKYEELVAKCEGASNEITDEIFQFWSQNEALAVRIELGEGKPEDPAPFNAGTVAKIRASVPLSERSAGFVWFFSFLAQFKQLKKTAGNVILLLDEPGLTLHGKAQADLLRYIQERLIPSHQVIYSTHSPFMVPAERLADVRVVEDVVGRDDRGRPVVRGTKVSADVLSVDKDTLFPLQGHLGYEITQSLFIGKNTLLVEGPSDILYLQVLSQALKNRKRKGLDPRWTICPSGGIDKMWSFASLFGGNKLNIAALCDYGHGDKGKVERIKQSQILKAGQIWTVADFTGKAESDVEDIFHQDFYLALVNQAYSLTGNQKLDQTKLAQAQPQSERIVKLVEATFRTMPPEAPVFDHFTPAEWLLRHPDLLEGEGPEVLQTLETCEKIFNTFNGLLK